MHCGTAALLYCGTARHGGGEGGIDSAALRRSLTPAGRRRCAAASKRASRVGRTTEGSAFAIPLRRTKKNGLKPVFYAWRRGRDSNPRYAINVYTLSRRAPSTTRPPLLEMGGGPNQPHPAHESATTVAPFRAWRGLQHLVAGGPEWATIEPVKGAYPSGTAHGRVARESMSGARDAPANQAEIPVDWPVGAENAFG